MTFFTNLKKANININERLNSNNKYKETTNHGQEEKSICDTIASIKVNECPKNNKNSKKLYCL